MLTKLKVAVSKGVFRSDLGTFARIMIFFFVFPITEGGAHMLIP